MLEPRGNRILAFTKAVAVLLGMVVLGAFVVLYFFPSRTAELFAWKVQPPMTAAFMGASYANGALFFIAVICGRRWHRVWAPHVGVFLFATLLLIATVLHWDKFNHGHPVFWAWIFIYVVAPVLVPWAVIANFREDPATPDERDAVVPRWLRLLWAFPGVLFLGAALFAFYQPGWVIGFWPWKLTPLTARVLVSFYSMLGVAVVTVVAEPRWSAWRLGAAGVALWHALVIAAAFQYGGSFHTGNCFGWWLYFEMAVLAGVVGTFILMESRVIQRAAPL